MSVLIENTLPEQPVLGVNTYTPLGGDGWTAPHSVAEVSISSAGDAGGGNNDISLTFDPRFISIVSYVRLVNSGASGTIEMRLTMLPSLPRVQPQVQAFANNVPLNALDTTNSMTWCPPPLPHLGVLNARTPNVNNDTMTLMAYIYQFQITALQQVPLNLILASLPRGDTMVTTMTTKTS